MNDYITNESTIIFDPKFNKPLDYKLLSNYSSIIFSDYELNDDLFDAYTNYNFHKLNYVGSKFNQPLSNFLYKL